MTKAVAGSADDSGGMRRDQRVDKRLQHQKKAWLAPTSEHFAAQSRVEDAVASTVRRLGLDAQQQEELAFDVLSHLWIRWGWDKLAQASSAEIKHCVHNLFIDKYRRSRRTRELPTPLDHPTLASAADVSHADPTERVARTELWDQLHLLLDKTGAPDREIVERRLVRGESYQAIAAQMHIKATTCRVKVSRWREHARLALRVWLGDGQACLESA